MTPRISADDQKENVANTNGNWYSLQVAPGARYNGNCQEEA